MNEMWCVPTEPTALEERVAHQSNPTLLEIAEAAVNELRAATRSALAEIALFEQGDAISARCRIDGDADASRPAADHHNVPRLGVALQSCDLCLAGETYLHILKAEYVRPSRQSMKDTIAGLIAPWPKIGRASCRDR